MGVRDKLQHAWNAFVGYDTAPSTTYMHIGQSYGTRPDRIRLTRGNDRSIITSIFNRIAIDVSSITIQHVKTDEQGRYKDKINSNLNECLTLSANLDQTNRAFFQDVVMSMFDEGCVAIVPVDTTLDPNRTNSYDIESLRVGEITQWYPKHVKVRLYNEETGRKQEVIFPKKAVAIVENPLYAIVNEPNSTMQRLKRKLALLDVTDEQTASGKLDLIIQLPYTIKTETRRQQADKRKKDIEEQLAGSKYGIAYTDGTEKITQLNRTLENNLQSQVEYLTNQLFAQLGITQAILDGTADEQAMLNYNNRTIEPILSAIVVEMKRKFLTKTARTQGQSIMYFRDPFRLVPVNNMAEIADKFTRNEIMTSNELRQVIGLKPSDDEKADMLINSNLNHAPEELAAMGDTDGSTAGFDKKPPKDDTGEPEETKTPVQDTNNSAGRSKTQQLLQQVGQSNLSDLA